MPATLIGLSVAFARVLKRKCEHARIEIPAFALMNASPFLEEIDIEWENMLGHQLPKPLALFESFWLTLEGVFGWLDRTHTIRQLPRAQFGNVDATWEAPKAITSWRHRVPLELLRYAGANRLTVDIDYRAEQGRQGVRRVEPYSLRRSQDGNLILFVVNESGRLRSYRVDRIVCGQTEEVRCSIAH